MTKQIKLSEPQQRMLARMLREEYRYTTHDGYQAHPICRSAEHRTAGSLHRLGLVSDIFSICPHNFYFVKLNTERVKQRGYYTYVDGEQLQDVVS